MSGATRPEAEPTAMRVALWRALHRLADAPPWVLDDSLALALADPAPDWQRRPDMDIARTSRARASIVGRARFIEDHAIERAAAGVGQYVILGAGLDTFAFRPPGKALELAVFEVDQPAAQAWKRERLASAGIEVPGSMHWVPVDFEAGQSWWHRLCRAGFDPARPAVFSSSGVSMYLSSEAIAATLQQIAHCAKGSSLVMTFMLPLNQVDADERPGRAATERYARAAGTPFLSMFDPTRMLGLAVAAGFAQARHVSSADLATRYFAGRADGLSPSSSEQLIVAGT